ncbi:hypothetical protein [Streptomyces sp. NPDC091268]|uniref:hypothetical protein n=1 Tax=Streptomyces sp. NPDC091268 TaxID=3365979 RepID=UPI003801FF7C
MHLDEVANQLYGLPPEEFTAARNAYAAAAREEGDRRLAQQITALRRPTRSAWASNLLVREQPGEVEPLVGLGEQLRQAHRELDGEQLRELSRRQRQLIGALSRQARQLVAEAGHRIGDDAQREIEETLHAVLADPEAARAWAAGRLTKPLSASVGFPGVEDGGAKAPPARPRAAAPEPAASSPRTKADQAQERRRQAWERAQRDADEAAHTLRTREEEARSAAREAEEAAADAQRLEERAAELAEQLKQANEEQSRARHRERQAGSAARDADRALREARRRAEAAAARVERLADEDG